MEQRPLRKPRRLKEYDYSGNGGYFVTICTANKQHTFGKIVDGKVKLSPLGEIAERELLSISEHRENVELCKAVVMPNHVHILFVIHTPIVSSQGECAPQFGKPTSNSLGAIIGGYKAAVSRKSQALAEAGMTSHAPTHKLTNQATKPTASIWQRNYYDHIIRNDEDFKRIWQYIDENPLKWELDEYYINP